MLVLDRDALMCDLAETYHIYDIRSLPVKLLATFAVGLREDSRIKKKISGVKYSWEELLLARIADRLAAIIWLWGGYGDEKQPPSLLDSMLEGVRQDPEDSFKRYDSPEAFNTAWNE